MDESSNSDKIFREKLEIDMQWLRHTLGGSNNVPSFEINTRTVDLLHTLAQCNTERNRECTITMEHIDVKTKEYQSEVKRLEQVLIGLGLRWESFNQSGTTSIAALSELAVILELKNTNTSSYYMALDQLSTEYDNLIAERETLRRNTDQLLHRTRQALDHMNELKRVHQQFEDEKVAAVPLMRTQTQNITYFTSKAQEYEAAIQELRQIIAQNGYNEEVRHNALVEMAQRLQNTVQGSQPLIAKLSGFHNLPPDVPLAKLKIEETRIELKQLEEQLAQTISNMELS